ncbi:MAG: GNAT family N-acetyltransferase [Proteobacteria bacterium]|nr:GNAT family N-acetyltransferase [Pseudomonadota bacterium]
MPDIITKDLTIRPCVHSDSKWIFRLSQEKSLAQWMPDQVYKDEKKALEVLEFLISQYRENSKPDQNPLVYAIVLTKDNLVIGHVGLSPYKSLNQIEIEIGYAIGGNHQGRGFATQAVLALSKLAIHKSWAKKIYGIVASENVGSGRVLEKSGYQLEGEGMQKYQGKERLCRRYIFS